MSEKPAQTARPYRDCSRNLSLDDRRRGGVKSAAQQRRDNKGRFVGVRR